jgi:hypothetical protein
MQAKILVPNNVNVDITFPEEMSCVSFPHWLCATWHLLRWAISRCTSPRFSASCGASPATACAYPMLVASDVTRHTDCVVFY